MLLNYIKKHLPKQCHQCRLTINVEQEQTLKAQSTLITSLHNHYFWCTTCTDQFFTTKAHCQRCGLDTLTVNNTASESPNTVCGRCLSSPPLWDNIYFVNEYQQPIKKYIQDLKYHRQFWLADDLAWLLSQCITDPAPECIPVPLHWKRLFTRGFNQSSYLTYALVKYLNQSRDITEENPPIMVNENVFKRVKATRQQKGLDKIARKHNIKQAFELVHLPTSKHVALIDDVVTTGSTLAPLCKILRQCGVERIDVYCLSRTPEPKS